jgi:deaminated glutathione amidase
VTRIDIALVQQAASLEPAENRAALEHLPPGDLVVLPESFARDFGAPGSTVAEYAEPLDGPFVSALVDAAEDRVVVGGMFERSDDPARPYNTVVVVDAAGVRAAYRKIHLYDSFGYKESDALTPGPLDQRPVVDVGGVRVGLMTCYDLRFPEVVRRIAEEIDLLVVPAAWVAGHRKLVHWRTLLTARAIENLVYVAGAAQPAPRYTGHSLVVDPRGDVLAEADAGDGEVVKAHVDTELVAAARSENPSLGNRRL